MKFRTQFLVFSLILIMAAQALNSALSLSSFEKVYRDTVLSQYEILVQDLRTTIENGLQKYKLYTNYVGIDNIFHELLERANGDIDSVLATDAAGKLLYLSAYTAAGVEFHQYEKTDGEYLDDRIFDDFSLEESRQSGQEHLIDGVYSLSVPIVSRDGWMGNVVMIFPETLITRKIFNIIIYDAKVFGGTLAVSLLLLLIGRMIVLKDSLLEQLQHQSAEIIKKVRFRATALIVVTLLVSQVLLSVFTLQSFQKEYLQAILEKTDQLAFLLEEDIEYLVSKGLPLHKLVGIERIMKNIVLRTPEYLSLSIIHQNGDLLYLADPTRQGVRAFDPGQRKAAISQITRVYAPQRPVAHPQSGEKMGYIEVNINKELILSKTRRLLLDYLTIVIVAILIGFEAMMFFIAKSFSGMGAATAGAQPQAHRVSGYLIRNMGFLSMYASFLFMCFYSLYFRQFSRPLWGMSADVVGGLPISVFMFASSVGFILKGKLHDRYGDKQSFLIGSLFFAVGLFLTSIATDILQIFGFQLLAGIGFGIFYLTPQSLIMDHSAPEERPTAMANLFAGFYGGIICGSAMGGIFAERLGYRPVFVIAAVTVLLTYLFSYLYVLRYTEKPAEVQELTDTEAPTEKISALKLLRAKDFILPLLAQGIPYQIVYVGVLFFLLPLFLKSLQFAESDIGRIIMIHGLVIISGPVILRFLSRFLNPKVRLVLAGILISAMLIVAYLIGGVSPSIPLMYFLIPWIIMIAICNSILSSGIVSLSMSSSAAASMGSTKAVGIYRLVERIGNISAPILCSALLAWFSVTQPGPVAYGYTMAVIGGFFLFGTLVILFFVKDTTVKQQ